MEKYEKLLNIAKSSLKNSYSPYSNFPVGAALLLKDGNVITGINVENASYGLGICAERVAVVKAISEGNKKFEAIAIVSGKIKNCYPCGSCLQFMAEFSDDLDIILEDENGKPIVRKIKEFLPYMFNGNMITD
jgi:cytidine deaminase